MASSGSFSDSVFGIKITVEWVTLSRDLAGGKTKVNTKTFITPTAGGFTANAVKPCSITFVKEPVGDQVKDSFYGFTKVFGTVSNNTKVLLGERVETFTHYSNGNRNVTIRGVCDIGLISYNGKAISSVKTEKTITLDDINRFSPTINAFSITTVTKNSVLFRAEATHPYGIDLMQYRLNGGTWITLPSSRIITGLTQNTTYTLQTKFRAGNGLWVESAILSFTTVQENQDPPVFVSLNATALSENSISVISQFTQSANLPVTKVVSLDNGVTYPYSEGNIATLIHNTTYQVKVKATASNGQIAYSTVQEVTTPNVMDKVRQVFGRYGEGVIFKKTDGVTEVNPNYLG
jgi:hypothetical protein